MGSRWSEVNWISDLWGKRGGSDTADIILLAIRQVMLQTLKSLKRSWYSQALWNVPEGFCPPHSPAWCVQGCSVDPPCGPSQDGEEPGSTLPTLKKADTLGRGEGSLHCLPVLEASLDATSPSASKLPLPTLAVLTDVVEVAPRSQQDVVTCKNVYICLQQLRTIQSSLV